jgi:hypothetical protein
MKLTYTNVGLISEMDFGGGRIGGLLSDIPQN